MDNPFLSRANIHHLICKSMETSDLPISIFQPFQSLSVSATAINFDQNFAMNKTCEELAADINHNLQLHTGNNIEKFNLYFCRSKKFLPDIENWVAFVVRRGVKEINLDFSMGESIEEENSFNLPISLFCCDTLTTLTISHCNFLPPPGFVGFQNLQFVSLTCVNITGDILQQFISNCSVLDSVKIDGCTSLESIIVSSQKLRSLTVVNPCCDYYDMEISAPKLESFIYFGMYIFGDSYFYPKEVFIDIPSLSAAFILAIESSEPEHDFVKMVHDLRHVNVLTVCQYTLWRVTGMEGSEESLPILLHNLKELQLIVGLMSTDLEYIYGFFRLCPSPFLERLFIQLAGYSRDTCLKREVKDPSDVNFDCLKVITVSNFLGCEGGMRLVSFLLQKAVNLETLVLIAPPEFSKQNMDIEQSDTIAETASGWINDLVSLHAQLSQLPKASPLASIVLCEHSESGMYWTPMHTEYFDGY